MLKEASEKLWSTKQALQDKHSTTELKAILRCAKQGLAGGPTDIVARVADCMIHGTLPVRTSPIFMLQQPHLCLYVFCI